MLGKKIDTTEYEARSEEMVSVGWQKKWTAGRQTLLSYNLYNLDVLEGVFFKPLDRPSLIASVCFHNKIC